MPDIFLIFPNVLKLGLDNTLLTESMSLTSDINISMTQDINTFPVTKRYQYMNGITKGFKQFSVAGIVTDDPKWGQFVKTITPLTLYRAYLCDTYERWYNDGELLSMWDKTIGYRNNLIITSLEITNSKSYEDATEIYMTLTQVKFIDYKMGNEISSSKITTDPYRYVTYGD